MINSRVFYKILVLLVFLTIVFVSCKKDKDDPQPTPKYTGPEEPASAKLVSISKLLVKGDRVVYFSLLSGDTIAASEAGTTYWDIAFKGLIPIAVNGGTSGSGKAGVIVSSLDFEAITEAPLAGYADDNNTSTPPPPASAGLSHNPALSAWWCCYNISNHSVSPKVGTSFIVRTAKGKYAKLQMTDWSFVNNSYSSNAVQYSFRYYYQPDGSVNLKN